MYPGRSDGLTTIELNSMRRDAARGIYAAPQPAGVPGAIEEATTLDPSRTSEILRHQQPGADAPADLDDSIEVNLRREALPNRILWVLTCA